MSSVLAILRLEGKANFWVRNINLKISLSMVSQLIRTTHAHILTCNLGVAIDDFPNYATFLGPNSLTFEASVIELMEVQANFHRQVVEYLWNKNHGSFRYAVMPRVDRVKKWTLSLREGQAKHPASDPTCQSYYKVRFIFTSFYSPS